MDRNLDRNTDVEVIRAAVHWLEESGAVTLITVARTWGSAPRRPGALMAIHPDGRFVGSVSGGCVEDDLVQRTLRGEFEYKSSMSLQYGVSTEVSQRVGLPCGGRLELLVEYLDTALPLRKVLEAMEARQRITRRVCLGTGEASLHPVRSGDDFSYDGENLVKVFGPAWRMLIIGAGELARRVAQLALTLDYAVTICDPRPEYICGWQVNGTEFTSASPVAWIERYRPDPYTVVLALAHSPSLEDTALAAALQTDAFYIGALGSRKNQAARLKRLQQMSLHSTQLARLRGPVGLDIGSHAPAEIAIAIHAELILERNQQYCRLSEAEARHG